MRPIFPQFELLSPCHRIIIEEITTQFVPYSDFNYTSLHSWNTTNSAAISTFDKNVIIRFNDYITGEPFYSFLGKYNVTETVEALISLTESEDRGLGIKLIPESVARNVDGDKFLVVEDADNFDYILSIDQLTTFEGSKFVKHRNKVSKFKRDYTSETKVLDLSDLATQKTLQQIFLKWEEWKQLPRSETENELKAVSRLFCLESKERLITVGIFYQDELLGFSISELLPNGYAMLHFEKATPAGFTGVYQYLKQETARILSTHGCKLLNCQQDLGLPGLRTHKMGLAPIAFLKKYRINRR